jgi:hypothetical protein
MRQRLADPQEACLCSQDPGTRRCTFTFWDWQLTIVGRGQSILLGVILSTVTSDTMRSCQIYLMWLQERGKRQGLGGKRTLIGNCPARNLPSSALRLSQGTEH